VYCVTVGKFFAAIPGGSVLKMLGGLTKHAKEIDWTKVYIFYVNHKTIPIFAPDSTHFKACGYFVNTLEIPISNVIAPTGSGDSQKEAAAYSAAIQELVPKEESGMPSFDYMLLGMGKHLGLACDTGSHLFACTI
jgi:6-phosphogluconolactonase